MDKLCLEKLNKLQLVRISTCGSVDDGKSTLIGRLLFECGAIFEDNLNSLEKLAKKTGFGEIDFSLLLDGLSAEREQKITIDVAYRFFSTQKRRFIISDVPGHEQYTRNMVTGISTANIALILIDARKGLLTQTKRHLFIASLLGVGHILVVINKMDLVGYREEVFEAIKNATSDFAKKLSIKDLQFIPVSSLKGDMLKERGKKLSWYKGPTLIDYLENVYIESDNNLIDFRFPIQYVIRPNQNFRGYAGKIESGVIHKKEEVVVLPSNRKSKIKAIFLGNKKVEYAFVSQSVVLQLEDELDASRGDMICKVNNLPFVGNETEVMLNWFSEEPLSDKKSYLIKHVTKTIRGNFSKPKYVIDVNTLHRTKKNKIELNDIGRATLKTIDSIIFDEYEKIKSTGSFIVIDEITNGTVGAGIITNKGKEKLSFARNSKRKWETQKGVVLWLTGLSGAGKTTIAERLFNRLKKHGAKVEKLDGDIVREYLTKDLGFSRKDRDENIRRTGFVCNLLSRNGIIVIASFISPYRKQRNELRKKIKNFVEIYVNTSLEICEKRDIKGMYAKARRGEVKNFTGISDPYQEPKKPEIVICGDKKENIDVSVKKIITYLVGKKIIS